MENSENFDFYEKAVKQAFTIINNFLNGTEKDLEKVKNAKFLIQTGKGMLNVYNIKQQQDRNDKRFNADLFDKYGSEEDKVKIRSLLHMDVDKLKLIKD